MYKKIFLLIFVIFTVAFGLSSYKTLRNPEVAVGNIQSPTSKVVISSSPAAAAEPTRAPQHEAHVVMSQTTTTSSSIASSLEIEVAPHDTARIIVDGKTYVTNIAGSETGFEAMKQLETSGLTFTYRNYTGMGALIESINGKSNADGYYWILYVNGTKSEKGISSVALSPGDVIEWKYEKGY